MKEKEKVDRADKAKSNIEETLNRLYLQKRIGPEWGFWLLVIGYLVVSIAVSFIAGSSRTVVIGGNVVSFYAFAGVLSSLSNIFVILLTVFYKMQGFIFAVVLLLLDIPPILMGIFLRGNMNSLPGIFGNLLALLAVIVIRFNDKRVITYQQELRNQAVTDMLTQIPNWFAFTELVDSLVKRGEPFAVVSIDINGFKVINDTMGFETGNLVLVDLSSRWKEIADGGSSGTRDFICRLNGDEFALVIRDFRTEEEALKTIRMYEAVLDDLRESSGYDFYITASFGYAFYPTDGKDMDSLISYSDIAMHEIKDTASSEHILRYSQDMHFNERTLEIEGKIRTALERDNVYFMLQPQFDMDHRLRGFEALARMRDVDGSVIFPGDFIPVAEKVGLVDRIDSEVFRKSAAFVAELIKKYDRELILSVNVSVRHLVRSDFLEEIRTGLRESGLPGNCLEVEITESIMIESLEQATNDIEELRALGVRIAIDDFGTGYSSLSYLNTIPAHLLKVDKSFIDSMNSSEKSKQYVAAIISLGHILGYEVISEGVEEEAQLGTLKEIGCDYIQGYLWGKPQMPEEIEVLVRES
ncbi:MAG: bifunctional diguanylate cyclase/phosphodiesterase [Lachnospiraceae bacterium]|nr:bifunctional diguanylate cyclase/phosphodiesterase [Lachnospiraceae bacterium]